ncbi:hypothetical protein [Burkholderia ubonensis]|uniref:hypothetical protein n=1 Tax=Burkholderia ubonensis TaxID=101571 RepID=UPI0012F890A9|nr:hypothetical protein [Burkholderia ubonensis]
MSKFTHNGSARRSPQISTFASPTSILDTSTNQPGNTAQREHEGTSVTHHRRSRTQLPKILTIPALHGRSRMSRSGQTGRTSNRPKALGGRLWEDVNRGNVTAINDAVTP